MELNDQNHPAWAIVKDLLAYLPALIVMATTTSEWDYESLVLLTFLGGHGGKRALERMGQRGE